MDKLILADVIYTWVFVAHVSRLLYKVGHELFSMHEFRDWGNPYLFFFALTFNLLFKLLNISILGN
jgi:hypothetical protein